VSGGPKYHRLSVADVIDETPDTRSFVLRVPAELTAVFGYRPGQFLTVRVPKPPAGSVLRCYSLASSPHTDQDLKLTVKRTPEGYASNWLCDRVTRGTVVDLLAPAGLFTPACLDSDLLLLAAGSGITPVMSIVKSALSEGDGHLALVYANRDRRSVIFDEELRRLAVEHPDRLLVRHWLDATHGVPTSDGLAGVLRPYAGREAFVCGPPPYLAVACSALDELGVAAHRVHVERFDVVEPEDVDPQPAATVEVTLDGVTHRLPWPAQTRLLDVLIAAGLNPPFSCRQGTCAACACRLLDGEVDLVHNEVLDEEDFEDGYILACQALPRSTAVTVTYH
jgi:3-ketosteroid 9alpha-monooxygenase subunit B